MLIVIALGALNRYRASAARDRRPPAAPASRAWRCSPRRDPAAHRHADELRPARAASRRRPPVRRRTPSSITGSDFATTTDVRLTRHARPARPEPVPCRRQGVRHRRRRSAPTRVTLRLGSVTQTGAPRRRRSRCGPTATRWVAQALDPSVAGTLRLSAQVRTGAIGHRGSAHAGHAVGGHHHDGSRPGRRHGGGRDVRRRGPAAGDPRPPTPDDQVHVTALRAQTAELPLRDLGLVASPATGERRPPGGRAVHARALRRARRRSRPGTWTIDAVATTRATAGRSRRTWQTRRSRR